MKQVMNWVVGMMALVMGALMLQVQDLREDARHQAERNREAAREMNAIRENGVDAVTEQWDELSELELELAHQRERLDALVMSLPRVAGVPVPVIRAPGCER